MAQEPAHSSLVKGTRDREAQPAAMACIRQASMGER